MTWLVRNPSLGLATAPDWELPEEDEVLAPLATLGAARVGSLAPPPSSAPPAVARSATVGPSLSGPPPAIDGRPPLLTPVKNSQGGSMAGKTVYPSSPVAPMKLLSEVGGELEVMGLEETGAPMDVDAGTPEPVGAKGPRAKRRRVEEDEAEDEDEDEEEEPIQKLFLDEILLAIQSLKAPWFADTANFISSGKLPKELNSQ